MPVVETLEPEQAVVNSKGTARRKLSLPDAREMTKLITTGMKLLLRNEGVQSLAEENAARRNSYADPHTLGHKTLAEVKDKLSYHFRIQTIDEVLREGGDADAVLPDGKHGPDWLVGRQGSLLALENTPAIPQPSSDELTAKITRDLESQMEAKVNRKVQENMTWFLKKLGEVNPTLKFDIGDFCATFSSDQDESVTPITQTPRGATS
ncbi:hypothetical protein OROMI_024198 [Orobanche minor]